MISRIIKSQDDNFFILVDSNNENYVVDELYKKILNIMSTAPPFRMELDPPNEVVFIKVVENINLAALKKPDGDQFFAWTGDEEFAKRKFLYSIRKSYKGAIKHVKRKVGKLVEDRLRF